MSFVDAVKTCFGKYADFSGRARRSEYWYFTLFDAAVSFLLSLIFGSDSFLVTVASIALLLPGLAVSVRRLHDINKSGWCLLLVLIPLVGAIILIVWACREGDAGANLYGENPKGAFAAAETTAYTPVEEPAAETYEAPAAETYEAPVVEDDPFSKENIQANYGTRYCASCGAELKPGQKFCEYCGTKV